MCRVEVSKHLVHGPRGHGPVGVLLGSPSQGARGGSSCVVVTAAHKQRWPGAASVSYRRRRPSMWL